MEQTKDSVSMPVSNLDEVRIAYGIIALHENPRVGRRSSGVHVLIQDGNSRII